MSTGYFLQWKWQHPDAHGWCMLPKPSCRAGFYSCNLSLSYFFVFKEYAATAWPLTSLGAQPETRCPCWCRFFIRRPRLYLPNYFGGFAWPQQSEDVHKNNSRFHGSIISMPHNTSWEKKRGQPSYLFFAFLLNPFETFSWGSTGAIFMPGTLGRFFAGSIEFPICLGHGSLAILGVLSMYFAIWWRINFIFISHIKRNFSPMLVSAKEAPAVLLFPEMLFPAPKFGTWKVRYAFWMALQ